MKKMTDFKACFVEYIKLSERDSKGQNALIKCSTEYNLTNKQVNTTVELSSKQLKDFVPKLDKLEATFYSDEKLSNQNFLSKKISDYPPAYSIIEKMNSILAYKSVKVEKGVQPIDTLKELVSKNRNKVSSINYSIETTENSRNYNRSVFTTTTFYPEKPEDKQYSFSTTKYFTVSLIDEVSVRIRMKEFDNKNNLEITGWNYQKHFYRDFNLKDCPELNEILTTGSLAVIKIYLEGVIDDYNKLESKEKQNDFLYDKDEKYLNKIKMELDYVDSIALQDKLKCIEKINNLYVDLIEKEDKIEKENDNYDYSETSEN